MSPLTPAQKEACSLLFLQRYVAEQKLTHWFLSGHSDHFGVLIYTPSQVCYQGDGPTLAEAVDVALRRAGLIR